MPDARPTLAPKRGGGAKKEWRISVSQLTRLRKSIELVEKKILSLSILKA